MYSCPDILHDFGGIPQLDGNDSDPDLSNSVSVHRSYDVLSDPHSARQCDGLTSTDPYTHHTASSVHHVKTLRAPFLLDRNKQLKKLGNDTMLKDFTITINNNDENVNVQCNTATYTLIAVPSFSDIRIDSDFEVSGIRVNCYRITGKVDDADSAVHAAIFLRLYDKQNMRQGDVTMHLHHTRRKIQLQGSAIMPNKSKAPVWFVDNVIYDRFSLLARTKSFDIENFNKSVRDLVGKHSRKMNATNVCMGCSTQFSGRSLPEHCAECDNYYHKKCFLTKEHHCKGKRRPPTLSLTRHNDVGADVRDILSYPDPAYVVTAIQQPSAEAMSLTAPAVSTSVPSSPSLALSSALSSSTTSQPATSPAGTSLLSASSLSLSAQQLPVLGQSYITQTDLEHPQNPPPSSLTNSLGASYQVPIRLELDPTATPFPGLPASVPSTAKNKNNAKPPLATTKDGIELEFAKTEIKTIRARLRDQETKIKDLKYQNSILLDRLSIFEKAENQTIYEQYFPGSGSDLKDLLHAQHPCTKTVGQPSCCCHVRSCCSPNRCCPSSENTSASPSTGLVNRLEQVANSLDELRKEVKNLKSTHDSNIYIPEEVSSTPLPPATVSDAHNVSCAHSSMLSVDENMPDISAENLN